MIGDALFAFFAIKLDHGDIYSPRTFLPLFYLKGNPVTFVEGFKSRRIDSRMVNKHIGALILFDETITFTLIKPFDNTIGHRGTSFVFDFHGSKLQAANSDKWVFPSERNRTACYNTALPINPTRQGSVFCAHRK